MSVENIDKTIMEAQQGGPSASKTPTPKPQATKDDKDDKKQDDLQMQMIEDLKKLNKDLNTALMGAAGLGTQAGQKAAPESAPMSSMSADTLSNPASMMGGKNPLDMGQSKGQGQGQGQGAGLNVDAETVAQVAKVVAL